MLKNLNKKRNSNILNELESNTFHTIDYDRTPIKKYKESNDNNDEMDSLFDNLFSNKNNIRIVTPQKIREKQYLKQLQDDDDDNDNNNNNENDEDITLKEADEEVLIDDDGYIKDCTLSSIPIDWSIHSKLRIKVKNSNLNWLSNINNKHQLLAYEQFINPNNLDDDDDLNQYTNLTNNHDDLFKIKFL